MSVHVWCLQNQDWKYRGKWKQWSHCQRRNVSPFLVTNSIFSTITHNMKFCVLDFKKTTQYFAIPTGLLGKTNTSCLSVQQLCILDSHWGDYRTRDHGATSNRGRGQASRSSTTTGCSRQSWLWERSTPKETCKKNSSVCLDEFWVINCMGRSRY